MVYYVKYGGITIDHIVASSDKEAKLLANKWLSYDDLICVDDNKRSLGGKGEKSK